MNYLILLVSVFLNVYLAATSTSDTLYGIHATSAIILVTIGAATMSDKIRGL